jgi:uncharacterized membrane protein YqjE
VQRWISLLSDVSASGREFGRIGLSLAKNRLELVSIELAEERGRVMGLVLPAAFALLFALLALVCLSLAAVFFAPVGMRLYVLVGLGLGYLLAALVCVLVLRSRIATMPPPFEATLSELDKDREALK